MKRLVAVNPWLAGRLRRAENGHTVLWIPDEPNAEDCFRVAEDNKLELGQVSEVMNLPLWPFLMTGQLCLDLAPGDIRAHYACQNRPVECLAAALGRVAS